MKPAPRETVTIITGKASIEFYNGLQIEGERVGVHPLNHIDDLVKKGNPDLVLLDCCDYTRAGLRLLNNIKSTKRGIPVFFLTDRSSEETAIEAFRIGAREYFKKPVDLSNLRSRIEKMLSLKRAPRMRKTGVEKKGERRINPPRLPATDSPSDIRRTVQYIHEHFSDEINLSRLAQEASLSKFHFSRVFKKHLGITPMGYVTHVRIQKAKELLCNADRAVSEVAREVGFHDLSNFARHFRRLVHTTPRSFKERQAAK
jgi:AraC-like DNA-binding protein/CheY-like chemotaxis protein